MEVLQDALPGTEIGQVCWIDLATSDATAAASFYSHLFGWSAAERHVRQRGIDGRFSTLIRNGTVFASLYQLTRGQIAGGVPSHWMPYVAVASADVALAILAQKQIVAGQQWGGLRADVGKDDSGNLLRAISWMPYPLCEGTLRGFGGLLEAFSSGVIKPTVVAAAYARIFHPPELEGSTAVRAMQRE